MRKLLSLAFVLTMGLALGCSTAVQEVGPDTNPVDETPPTMDEMYPPEIRKQMDEGQGFTGADTNTDDKKQAAEEEK